MARNAKQAQRAAQKRKQREKQIREEKTRKLSKQQGRGSSRSIAQAEDLPIAECLISKGWRERGLAHILLTRDLGDGHLLVGGYYVDIFCVGLKDTATIPRVAVDEYTKNVKPTIFNDPVEFEPVEPEMVRAVVEGSIAYAGELGFRPNRRWADSRKVLSGIEAKATDLKFGRDGKPCLILRDGDNLRGAQARLQRRLQPDEYVIEDQRGESGVEA